MTNFIHFAPRFDHFDYDRCVGDHHDDKGSVTVERRVEFVVQFVEILNVHAVNNHACAVRFGHNEEKLPVKNGKNDGDDGACDCSISDGAQTFGHQRAPDDDGALDGHDGEDPGGGVLTPVVDDSRGFARAPQFRIDAPTRDVRDPVDKRPTPQIRCKNRARSEADPETGTSGSLSRDSDCSVCLHAQAHAHETRPATVRKELLDRTCVSNCEHCEEKARGDVA